MDRAALAYVIVTLGLASGWGAFGLLGDLPVIAVALVVMMIPLAVAVVFVKLVHRESLTDYGLGRRAGLGGWRMLALAFFGPLVFTIPLLGLSHFVFHNPPHESFTYRRLALALGFNIPVVIVVSTFTNSLGEELGWRGYLLRRLRRTMSWRKSTVVIGLVWALYHLPLILLSKSGAWPAATAVTYSVAVVAMAVPFTWMAVRSRHGSVIVPSLLHASVNAWNQTLVGEPAFGLPGLLQGDAADTWILSVEGLAGAVIAVVVAAFAWRGLRRMDAEGVELDPPRLRGASVVG